MGGGAFADRARLNLKNQKTKKNDPYQNQSNFHQNFYSEFLRKILNRLNRKRYFFANSNHGTILIEFAFCVPVLILLLLYINDIMILARTQDEMKRAAYCAVQLIQNVSKCRNNNKFITKKDIESIARAWTIMVPLAQNVIKNNYCVVANTITLVKGTGNDLCTIKWCILEWRSAGQKKWIYFPRKASENFDGWGCSSMSTVFGKKGRLNQQFNSTSLYKDLHIKQEELKVIVELCYQWDADNISKALDLHILKPKEAMGNPTNCRLIFFTHVIFKPINGIFDNDNPPK